MEGQKGKKTHFTGPFQLPFGVQKECQKETRMNHWRQLKKIYGFFFMDGVQLSQDGHF